VLLAVDPGLRGCGVALFDQGRLVRCAYVRGSRDARDAAAWAEMAAEVYVWGGADATRVVSEFPKVYTVGKSKGDPEDLLQLAAVVGAISAHWGTEGINLEVVRPYEWKRQVPKDVMTERIKAKLDPQELAQAGAGMPAKSYQHNCWDAIGIGLNALGRIR
jgi:hypothetical protein